MMKNHPPPMNSTDPESSRMSGMWRWVIACFLAVVSGLGIYLFIFLFYAPCGSAKLSQVEADMRSFDSALTSYKLASGSFPTTDQGLNALVEKPILEPLPRRWWQVMKKLPRDPWGSPYDYKLPGRKDPTKPEIISRGLDGVAYTADDLSSQDE